MFIVLLEKLKRQYGHKMPPLELHENISSHLPHPPPPIGGALGPAPWFILPMRRLPPGGPGGLRARKREQ